MYRNFRSNLPMRAQLTARTAYAAHFAKIVHKRVRVSARNHTNKQAHQRAGGGGGRGGGQRTQRKATQKVEGQMQQTTQNSM